MLFIFKINACSINRLFLALLELLFQAAFSCREEIAAFDSHLQVSPANINAINLYLH